MTTVESQPSRIISTKPERPPKRVEVPVMREGDTKKPEHAKPDVDIDLTTPEHKAKVESEKKELKEGSQAHQFAEVVVAIRQERERVRAQKEQARLYMQGLPQKQRERLEALIVQIKSTDHPITLADIHDPQERQVVSDLITPPERMVRDAVQPKFFEHGREAETPQELFCNLLLVAPMAYRLQTQLDALKNKPIEQRNHHDRRETQRLTALLIPFNHMLKEIILRRDGSFTRSELVSKLENVGEWHRGHAARVVAGFAAEVAADELAAETMSDIARVVQPTAEQDMSGIDVLLVHRDGRVYKIDWKMGEQHNPNRITQNAVVVPIDSKWIRGFAIIPAFRSALAHEIRSCCGMPSLRSQN